ncbi:hypothetical protein BST81_01475 [Leptolyngbya sp. 'hensonii']|uniref:CBS domain-containing protein n=1 Tax=Leptolyngbya sp. 'hensonii' TaxID=1922337 RepID=UPI00095001C1|nr:CBS domain-containing protein [Leptolyngbya sp. 'hensonii']OLP20132.1 hypothetical protein BST81_01475 [Leptolyngbya sp. 'hensonii']
MHLILCPIAANFDALGAAIGLRLLQPEARILLTGDVLPAVQTWLTQSWLAQDLMTPHQIKPEAIQTLTIVNTQRCDRLGQAAQWLNLPQIEVILYDHAPDPEGTLVATKSYLEPVGATTTLVAEQVQIQPVPIVAATATLMALGLHSETASLTSATTTPRDSMALAWLMNQGANPIEIGRYLTPQPILPTARELMSSPVRTVRPETTIAEAQRILLRYGHSGLSVVDSAGQLVGLISRRDIDIALHHHFGQAPVKAYMTTNLKTINPDTRLPEIEFLMVTYDIGRLPVLEQGQLVGIVTRTDVLRQLYWMQVQGDGREAGGGASDLHCPLPIARLNQALIPELWAILDLAAREAERQGWHLYLVGGGVRDTLMSGPGEPLALTDIDLVVDSFHQPVGQGAGVVLAQTLLQFHPDARLQIHGQFQTAALLWHHHPVLDSLWVDIATARTEFYPYPAANPEVEASSIQQDLYRRDFTINAMALRLTEPGAGQLLDFFGGWLDLQMGQIRVLHANSFIEDPTRMYRAVRFAVKLEFEIEPQTERYIRYAIATGVYDRIQGEQSRAPALQTRLKSELKYILQAPYWQPALRLLDHLEALRCLHPTLQLDKVLWRQLRLAGHLLWRFDPQQKRWIHWQMLLEVLLAHLPPETRGPVATNLQLPTDSITRLTHLAQIEAELAEQFLSLGRGAATTFPRPSQMVQIFRPYDESTLCLVAIRSTRPLRRQIGLFLSRWSQTRSPLDGHALKRLGYKPGQRFKTILEDLTIAFLDGVIQDQPTAEAYLVEHYPLPPE